MMARQAVRETTLRELVGGLAEAPALPVSGVALDSRNVQPGDVFLACRGLTVHGLQYLHQALRLGAAAVLWEPAPGVEAPEVTGGVPAIAVPQLSRHVGEIAARFYGNPSQQLDVVGITGTNGKTSVSQLIAQALTLSGRKCGVMGTLGYGLFNALGPATHTTPDAVQVQSWLAGFYAMGARFAAMEVSSHALDQDRVAGTRFKVAVFTNLTRDHLDYHGDLATYAAAKRRLFTTLAPESAVINLDDPLGASLQQALPSGTRGVVYTLDAEARPAGEHLRATTLELHSRGLTLELDGSFGAGVVNAQLLGRFNAANLLAVIGSLVMLGLSLVEILDLVPQLRPVPGRMECLGGGEQPLMVIDYAHTPDALRQALSAARAHCRGRLICVFGCGGDRDRGKRPEMAEVAETLADRVVLTDDNPRTEDGDAIIAEIRGGLRNAQAAVVERDRAQAIASALGSARAGDVILVAGKGHEDYQIIGTEKRAYSDRQTVMQLLGGMAP